METQFGEYTAYHKTSYTNKKANNYKWIENNINFISDFYDSSYIDSELAVLDENYLIANGYGKIASGLATRKHLKSTQSVFSGSDDIKYYDLIRKILVRMWGEQKKRKLKFATFDSSGYNLNLRKKKRLELHQEFIQQNILAPIQQEAQMEVFSKYGVENPADLNPEEQQQVQSEVETMIKFKTPKDIEKFMRDEYKSHSESQLHKLTQYLVKEYNLKFILDESYKDLTIAGFEAVEIDIKNKRPWIQNINPKQFRWLADETSPRIQDGEWWIHEHNVTVGKFVNEYLNDEKEFNQFMKSENLMGSENAVRRFIRGEINPRASRAIANEVIAPAASIDVRTGMLDYSLPETSSVEGQGFYNELLSRFGSRDNNNANTIRVARTVFTSFDKLQYVERLNPKTGKLDGFYVGENYESNPEKDYRVTNVWAKALYEGHTAGYGSDGYCFRKKRVLFQNRSLNDPFTVYAPFIGMEYSKLYGNTPRTSPVQLGKIHNYEYIVVKNQIEKLEEKNLGKLFLFPDKAVPYNWDFDYYVDKVKKTGFAPISMDEIDYTQLVANLFKGIDMSVNQDIASKQVQMQNIAIECQEAMNYSPSLMGNAPASMTATNNQQNIIQGSYAMEDIASLHRNFEQDVLNSFANLTRNALRDNTEMKTYLLDDLGIAELDLSPDVLNLSELGITIINDSEEVDNIRSYKQLLQPLIQNQLVSNSQAIKIQFSDSPADLINLAEEAEDKLEKSQEARQQKEDEMMKQQMELQKQQMDQEAKFRQLELAIKEMGEKIKGEMFRNAKDVDKDGRNDELDLADLDNTSKEKIAKMQIDSKEKLQKDELEVKREEIRTNAFVKKQTSNK